MPLRGFGTIVAHTCILLSLLNSEDASWGFLVYILFASKPTSSYPLFTFSQYRMAPLVSYGLLALFARCTLATVSSTSYELCTTQFGTSPKTPVPSTTYILALTFHPTLVVKSTPVTTVTPAPATTTVTYTKSVTSNVASTVVTSTSTAIVISTSTLTSKLPLHRENQRPIAHVNTLLSDTNTYTSTITTSTTTTLSQSTSTIPTSSGFTYPSPVPSPPPTWNGKRGAIDLSLPERRDYARDLLEARGGSGVTSCHRGPSGPTYSPARYPTSIVCGELIEVFSTSTVFSTASTKSTVSAPQSTITTSKTITSTSTVYSAASTTITTTQTSVVLSTTSIPTTTTTTVTNTATVTPAATTFVLLPSSLLPSFRNTSQKNTDPPPTQYAACAPSNVLTPPDTYFFSGSGYNPGNLQMGVQTPDNTAYECCVSCLLQIDCKVAEYFSQAGDGGITYSCTQDFGASYTSCDGGEMVSVDISPLGGLVYNTSVSAFSNCGGGASFYYD